MPKGALLTDRFFPERTSRRAEHLEHLPEDLRVNNSPLCRDCFRFLRGLPQTWTEIDQRDFVAMVDHERLSYELDGPDQAQRIIDRCHVYDLKDMFRHAHDQTCHLCAMIRAAFSDDNMIREEYKMMEEDFSAGRGTECRLRITLQTHLNVGRFPYCLIADTALIHRKLQVWTTIHLIPSTEADLTATGQPIGPSTSSDTSFALAKSWLSSCLRDHVGCSVRTIQDDILPARLLDIEHVQKTGRVSVHETSSRNGRYEYLTLSHCWGVSHRLLLTKENREELTLGISVNRLALTFQHAIEVTRQLGYRYLWIDSLCIVQNSVEDWNIEASKMASIYSGSICCIAASASSDSAGGCFRDRNPMVRQPLRIEHKLFPNIPAFDYPGPTLLVAEDILGPYFADSIANRPLETRGWTLQESVLAPRTLEYCMKEVGWECRKTTASETWPVGVPGDLWNQALDGYSKSVFDTSRLLPLESKTGRLISDERILYCRWEKLVNEYNERSLTRSEDIFPALAGMADMMVLISGDEYCAGLWRRDFRRGLTWRIGDRYYPKTRPPLYLAPTWSWASVNGFAAFDNVSEYTSDMECEVEEVCVEQLGGVTSGKVLSGKAVLNGMMRRVQWAPYPDITRTRRLLDQDWTGWLDRMVEAFTDTVLTEENPNPIYLFQLYRSTSTSPYHKHKVRCMHGLILEATDLAKNEFRRVGYMRTHRSRELNLQDWSYFEEKGWTRERITIY